MNFVMETERNIKGPMTVTSYYVHYTSVLDLVGMELTFFITVSIVLGFGFVKKMVLITHHCFGYC